MALVHGERVRETSTTTGAGTYSLDGVPGADFQTFVAGVGNGNTCYYSAWETGVGWEVGIGTVTDASPDTLARTTILASSNAGSAVDWPAGTRTLIVAAPAARHLGSYWGFPAGTAMLFKQTAAPTGWTKQTDLNNYALRLVSGTPTTSGSVAFSTLFARTATDATTLTTSTIPSHSHSTLIHNPAAGFSNLARGADNQGTGPNTGNTGSGNSHTHNIDMRVLTVDLIYALKD